MTTPTDPLTQLTRHQERGRPDRERLDELLDLELVGTLSTVLDGQPWAVPMLFARLGDEIVLHGSTGAGALRHLAAGAPAVFTVFRMDALVVAGTTFDSSANYRSATIRGRARLLPGEEGTRAVDALADRLIPGRHAEVRANTARERAATAVLMLPIVEGNWLVKVREHGPTPAAESDADGAWTGLLPVVRHYGTAEPADDSLERAVPQSVSALEGRTL